MPTNRHATGRGRAARIIAAGTALSVTLAMTVTPAMAETTSHASVSVSSVWNWLTRSTPTVRVPAQQTGSARGLPHYVPASTTRAKGGHGHPRGLGRGQLPAFRRHGPARRVTTTRPNIGNGSHSFNPATSRPVRSLATATSTLYRNADGSYTRLVYSQPINYRAPNGSWHPIATALTHAASGRLRETANSMAISLAPDSASSTLVSVDYSQDERISYALAGAASVPAKVAKSAATYRSVLPYTDLRLATVASGLDESLILRSPRAPSSWVFPLKLTGLTASVAKNGGISLSNATGQVVAVLPPAFMQDSSFAKRSGSHATSTAVTYQLISYHGEPAIQMTADRTWLDDPHRVYPVTIDPNFQASGTTYTQYGSPGDYSDYDDLEVGTWDNGGQIGNSFLAFSGLGSSLAGQHISAASLHLFDYWASTCTAEPFNVAPVTQSWSVTGSKTYPGPSYGGSIGSATITPATSSCTTNTSGNTTIGSWMAVTLSTGTFNSWTTGGADYGLAVYAATTGDLSWKRFDSDNTSNPPYLALTYTPDVPPQLNSQYPPDNYQSPTLTPELIAAGSDPDNWPASAVKYDFTLYTTTGTQVATSGNIATGDWVVPAGKLSWAQTYYWTVQAYDGYTYSSAQSPNYFTTQVPQPLITSTLAQNSDGHGFDQSVGNYTTSATDASVQTAGPSLSVMRDYNSLDPRVSGAFGAGWSSLYDMKATEVDNAAGAITSVVIAYPDGSEVGFGDNNGTFTAPLGRYATLTALASHGGYTLTDKNDTTYTFTQAGSSPNVFDISSIADYDGHTETFTYANGQLTMVKSLVSSRTLNFAWSRPSGSQYSHVTSVSTDPATPGQSSTALTWTYNYAGDELTSVCPPTSPAHCTTYSYTTGSHFSTAVLDAGPATYWRLDETSGTTAADSVLANEGVFNATYSGVTLGQPGPLPGSTATAASFNGTSSYVQLPASLTANASYLTGSYVTAALWFKTSSDNEVLLGSSKDPISAGSTAGNYVPNLYVGSDGKLEGEFYGTSTAAISSASSVADGNWHYVVLTAAGNTQSLYLDGNLVGNASVQVGVSGQPNVYVGTGFLGGNWPDESHHAQSGSTGYASYFTGSISDVALYSQYLTGPTVSQLYATGQSSVGLLNKITTPSGEIQAQISYNAVTDRVTSVTDSHGGTWTLGAPSVAGSSAVYRSAVLGAAPAGYWRLDEEGAPAQATDEVLGGPGSYNNVTLGATGPFSDETAASFNGTTSYVQLPSSDSPGTGPASVGLWFMVPKGSTAGGVLYDYESNAINSAGMPAGSWVPGLYVGTDGKLRGEFWNGSGSSPITSSGTVNDGNWHYAVLSATSAGQSLYLDGTLVGTSSTALAASSGSYVYVGAGESSGSWPDHPANTLGYFTGSIAEVAFYRSALTQTQVLTQYAAAKNSGGLAPTETITVTDPGGHPLTYAYDPLEGDRLIAQTDALGNRTRYGYDTSGFLYTTTEPNGNVITTGHDVRGNLVSQTTCQNQAAGICSTEYYTYYPDDTSTNLAADPRDDLILTMRDGRSSSATDNRYLTSYTYNVSGNQTSATTPPVPGFPNGRTTSMTYTTASTAAVGGGTTPAGLLATTTTPGGGTETIGYYAGGDVASITDPAGEVTKYSYDALGRVTGKTIATSGYPNGLTTSYSYNGAGQVLTEADPAVTDQVTGAVHTPLTTNAYDVDGNLTSVTVSDLTGGDASRTTSYAFNGQDELASKTDALGKTTTFTYDAYGNQVSQTDASGHTTDYAYDADGHLLTVSLIGYTGDPANPSAPVTLVEQSRAYDPDGRLACLTDSMGRQTLYTYTDNGLVGTVARTNPATGQSYTEQSDSYDAAGNLIARTTDNGATLTDYTVDAADRTTSSTLDPAGLDRTTTNSFSPDDFVLNTTVSGGGTVVSDVDKTYDALGRATSTTVHDDSAGHPVGWWPLTDGSAVTSGYSPTFAVDASGSGDTAFTSAGMTWAAGAASFNGSSGMLTAAAPVLNTTQSYSVSAWVNLAGESTSQGYDAVSEGGNSTGPFELQYSGGNGGWSFTSASADSASHSYYSAHLSTKPALNVWTHLVGVFNASTGAMSLYVNGALAASGSNPTPFNGTGPIGIGGLATTGAQSQIFDGQVADVQLYQRALSAADVGTLYSGGRTGGALNTKALTRTWSLDQRGLPTAMTDADGNTTSYLYDQAGKLTQVTEPAISTEVDGGSPLTVHPVISYGYDTFGEQVSVEDPDGNITTTNYDADGRSVATVLPAYDPPGGGARIVPTASQSYNAIGQVLSQTDPLGNTTSYSYDQLGDVATVTQPGGGITHYAYDTDGEQLSVTNPVGAQSEATYDFLGRQLTGTALVRQPTLTAEVTANAYTDPAGFLSATTTPAGVTTSYAYDAAGEVTSATDGAGNITRFSYDGLGRQVAVTLPDGTSQHSTFDEAGNPIGTSADDASGSVLSQTAASFDANGNLTASTDAMGNQTAYRYDALGLPVSEVQPVSPTTSISTSFGYDAAGNLTRYTDGNGNPTIYTYNSWNLPESTIVPATAADPDPADRTFTTAYNADGESVSQTAPGGVTATSTYDPLGDVISEAGSGADAPTATRTFGYNAAGDLTSASTPSGSEDFSYDDRGLLLSASGSSGSSAFSYNADGQVSSQTTPAGVTSYSYDQAGRLASLTDPATSSTLSYSYNSDSLPTSISYGTGKATQAYGYNGLHELTSDTLTAPDGSTEASISYGYNADGDETSKTTTGLAGASSNTYAYDEADRLTSWNNGVTTVSYGYDADGNRTSAGPQSFSYDARDELLSGGGSTYSYTARGTLASVTNGSGTTNATFDAFNDLISQGSEQFSYDALGRSLTGQGVAFSYLGVSSNLDSDGTSDYTWDPAGALVGVRSGSQSALVLTDQHTDVVGQFTAAGSALSWSTDYDPLGNVITTTGMLGDLGYQSGWTDPVSSDVHMGSRWYNPATGQFISRDAASNSPMPDSVAANTYAFGDDNPLTSTDPMGTCGGLFGCIGAAFGAAGNAVHNVVNTATTAISNVTSSIGQGLNNLATGFGNFMAQAKTALTNLATTAVHTFNTAVQKVADAYNTVKNTIVTTYNTVSRAVTTTVTKVVTATAHAVKYAASAATQFVQSHAAAIVSFAASTLVFMGCEAAVSALTAGAAALPGAVGCSALAGAVGNAVTYAMTTPVSKWSVAGFATTALAGAATGAASGFLGSLGSELLGPVVDAVASRLGPALVDDAADAATDVADDALSDASSDAGAAADAGPSTDTSPSDGSPSTDSAPSTDSSPEPNSAPDSTPSPDAGPDAGPDADPEGSASDDEATVCSVNSFVGKTRVLLADGSRVAIRRLKVGERVLAADPAIGTTGARRILRVIRHTGLHAMVAITIAGGFVINATAHHLLWDASTGKFTYASALKSGEQLARPGGRLVTVTRTRPYRANLTAYNLSISGIHTYYVLAGRTAILVHNNCKAYKAGLKTRPAVGSNQPAAQAYQIANAGPTEYLATGGGSQVWADGIDDTTGEVLDAKYVGNADRSPFVPGSKIPSFIQDKIQPLIDDEFQRYADVINDPANPLTALRVITNEPKAVPFFQGMMTKFGIPGTVVVVP